MVDHFDFKHRCHIEKNVTKALILPGKMAEWSWESRHRDHELSVVVSCNVVVVVEIIRENCHNFCTRETFCFRASNQPRETCQTREQAGVRKRDSEAGKFKVGVWMSGPLRLFRDHRPVHVLADAEDTGCTGKHNKLVSFFKCANPGYFFVNFSSFQTNNTIFTTNQCEKMSWPYGAGIRTHNLSNMSRLP